MADTYNVANMITSPVKDGWIDKKAEHGALAVQVILSSIDQAKTVILLSEPGFNKSQVIKTAYERALSCNFPAVLIDHQIGSKDASVRKFIRTSRDIRNDVENTGKAPLICIMHLPSFDEMEAQRLANAILRLNEAGCSVCLPLCPELEFFAEMIPRAQVVYSDMLKANLESLCTSDFDVAWLGKTTRSIPYLVESFNLRDIAHNGPNYPRKFSDHYIHLAQMTLRDGLMQEELKLRLSMYLLGRGSFDELKRINMRVDDDLLGMLQRDDVFFCVDGKSLSFDVLMHEDEELFVASLRRLHAILERFPQLTRGVIDVLCERNDLIRAAHIAELEPASPQNIKFVLRHGLDLIECGCAHLVRDALLLTNYEDPSLAFSRKLLSNAYSALFDKRPNLSILNQVYNEEELNSYELKCLHHAQLLVATRAQVHGTDFDKAILDKKTEDKNCKQLIKHLRIFALISRGEPRQALQLLLADEIRLSSQVSYSEALLELDYAYLRVLLPGMYLEQRAGLKQAKAFFNRYSDAFPSKYLSLIAASSDLMHGRSADDAINAAMRYAAYSQDAFMHVGLYILGILEDLSRSNFTRAHIRADQAYEIAQGRSWTMLVELINLLELLIEFCLGVDPKCTPLLHAKQQGLRLLAKLISCVVEQEESALVMDDAQNDAFIDVFWIVVTLVKGVGDIAKPMFQALPNRWQAQLLNVSENPTDALCETEPYGFMSSETLLGPRQHNYKSEIELKLLGKVELLVRGHVVPIEAIEKRRGKAVLIYIGAAKQHLSKRYEIIESVFPDNDYETGNVRISQAISTLRQAIKGVAQDLEPIIVNRAQRTVALNSEIVSCDVDEFERLAHEALKSEDDRRVVQLINEVNRIYSGDLIAMPYDAMGFLSARRSDLRNTFVECMLCGAEAALRIGRPRTAVRFAERANAADNLREDAVDILLHAMQASGRETEAIQRYKNFAVRLVNETGELPSRALRSAHSSIKARRQAISHKSKLELNAV